MEKEYKLERNSLNKLLAIKILHTGIWGFYNVVIFYLAYAVVYDKINKWVWIGLGLVGIECLVLVFFKMTCPLTIVARKYTDSRKDNFDIFLPNWLARFNKLIYTVILVVILLILAYRLL